MGAELDRLEIQIETKATKVNNSLDTLVTKLDKVSGALSHLNSGGLTGLSNGVAKFAQASTQLASIDSRKFETISKNITKIANINTQQIYGASSAMTTMAKAMNSLGGVSANSAQIIQVADAVSRLGGVSVQRAITNLPALANALNDLIVTLSKAPAVSNNVIQLTQSLANLASQGAKVGTASNSINKGISGVGTALTTTTFKARGFASIVGSFYQKYFIFLRGANKLWDSIENSMSYVETLNYFDAAFGQVAESAVGQWEEMGVESADSYYESFSKRAEELTSKMTGFNINTDGTLSATGGASLGINPAKLMNYQATFAQMSSSMGVASETSLKLSQALTEIGADLASVKNMDFDKVWTDMASGLAGMSRTLDKYGVNIRNVNLQQKLTELGINANITALNQNDKALLRAIILLDSTKYAWGDLADTINYPANQMRLLESNISNLSRTLGNLFLPALSNVLPYVNGFVIAIQRLLTWVGNLMGIDLSEVIPSIGSSEVDMSELLGDTEDLTGSLDNASNAAKKLKSNLQGFDELNVITTSDNSSNATVGAGLSSGLLDDAFNKSFEEYQAAWDEAFANMENRANEFADKIEGFFQPIKDIIEDFAVGDYFKAGQDTSKLVVSIFDFFSDAIAKVDWYGIGYNMGEFLEGIEWTKLFKSAGNFMDKAIDAAINLWEGAFDANHIGTVIVSALGIAHFSGLDKVIKDKIVEAFPTSVHIGKTLAITGVIFTISFTVAEVISKKLIEWANEKHDWGLSQEWIDNTFKELTMADLFSKEGIEAGFELFGGPEAMWLILFGEKIDIESWINENILSFFSKDRWSEVGKYFGMLGSEDAWSDAFETIGVTDFVEDVKARFDEVGEYFKILFSKDAWSEFGSNMKDSIISKWEETIEEWGIVEWWNNDIAPWFSREKWDVLGENVKTSLEEKWTGFTEWWQTTGLYKWWSEDVEPYFSKETWSWTGIKDGLSEAWDAAIESIKNLWNNFAVWLNDKLTFNIDTSSLIGKGISELLGTTEISLGVLPTFQTGGFPEDGLFMANHNELVGRFSNGKTAVANNQQITEGIAIAVHDGNYEQNELLREQNELLKAILQKETGISHNDIFRSVRQSARDYHNRTGNPAFY